MKDPLVELRDLIESKMPELKKLGMSGDDTRNIQRLLKESENQVKPV